MYKLPKNKKILKAQEFKQVLNTGRKFVVPELVLFARENSNPSGLCRSGLIVTKKIGNAVVRNKVKRRLREIFRTVEPLYRKKAPLDLVFIARHRSKTASYQKLSLSFEFALKNLIKQQKRNSH